MKRKLICTPAVVGMLKERGWTLEKIAARVGQPIRTVRAYWDEWRGAEEKDRALARSGTYQYLRESVE